MTRRIKALVILLSLVVAAAAFLLLKGWSSEPESSFDRDARVMRETHRASHWNEHLAPNDETSTFATLGSEGIIQENEEALNEWYNKLVKENGPISVEWSASRTPKDARWILVAKFVDRSGKLLKRGTWLFRIPLTRRLTAKEIAMIQRPNFRAGVPRDQETRELSRLPIDSIKQARNIAVLLNTTRLDVSKGAVEIEGNLEDPDFFIKYAGQVDISLAVGKNSIKTVLGRPVRLRISKETPIRRLFADRQRLISQHLWTWSQAQAALKKKKYNLLRVSWIRGSEPERLEGKNRIANPNGVIAYLNKP